MDPSKRPAVLMIAPDRAPLLQGFGSEDLYGRMPNIGILYLAAALKESGYEAVPLDRLYSVPNPFELALEISTHDPFLVGFGVSDATLETTRSTLSLLRLVYKGPVVLGGYTPTLHAADILREWPDVDFVVVREGEKAIVALADYLHGRGALEDVPNLAYRDGEQVRFGPEHNLLDVTALPWPMREWPENGDVTPILTRRGCTSRCAFCSAVPFYDRTLGPAVRMRHPSDVVDEIACCIEHGSTDFMFYDDCFGLSTLAERAWSEQFLGEVRTRDLHFGWGIELRIVDVLRGEPCLRRLCDIGLAHISLGMESLLPRQLELYNKGYDQADALRAVELARSLPLDFQTNVIFWDPFITLGEAVHHLQLLDQIGIQDQLSSANFPFFANVVTVRKGTGLHSLLLDANVLRLRRNSFCEYEFDFADPEVVTFRRGEYLEFLRRCRAVARPAALWMLVPRLERAGLRDQATALRTYAKAISRAEFEYFRALLTAARDIKDRLEFSSAAQEIHQELGIQVDACAALLPDLPLSPRLRQGV
jgi:hypothetical protein